MKLHNSKQGHYESGPNMTPLVDVVMVILIFMMLAGSFGAATHFLPWNTAGSNGTSHGPIQLSTRLDVYVSSVSDDTFQAKLSGGESFNTTDALRDALNAKRLAHEANGLSPDTLQIMINPRLSTRYRHIAAVYEAAMEAKWTKVGFHPARE